MKKLTVDEIIQGLVNAYERLLKLESNDSGTSYIDIEYFETRGEIKALRWVLGQERTTISETILNEPEKEERHYE